ncbi:hypothetical protein [Hydrogenophaga palleronii]|uniref:hypothetical protein n=1 Tax=Hydrogenophaga palleronii TaxID=65655 RepID=UPI0008268F44|nr:hypothetical protein [Hydrogenophaga palleronii]
MSVPFFGCTPCHRLRALAFLSATTLLLVACSPTFNWRALRPEGAAVQALMPCKPESATRPAPLDGGAPVELHMHSCEAGGLTFALAWAELGDAARVPAALAGWRRASLVAVRVDPARADDPDNTFDATVAGAAQVQGLRAQGTGPTGQPVQMRAVQLARGTQVVQAAVYGPAVSDELAATFFEGIKLP